MIAPARIVVSGAFDDIRSADLRFLQEASRMGNVTVLLWRDGVIERQSGKPARFPFAERLYFLNAVRYVTQVLPWGPRGNGPGVSWLAVGGSKPGAFGESALPADVNALSKDGSALPMDVNALPADLNAAVWVDVESGNNAARAEWCGRNGVEYRVLTRSQLSGFPAPPAETPSGRKKVVVTGCYDWFHSGHVRFCEEVSTYGDLYVIVGHDANIRLLKGDGHPLLPQNERRYVLGSIKYVTEALVSSGEGWLDADPEIRRLKPDIYAVNEDGDKGGKREYCRQMGIEYLVLKRVPAPGLPRRSSTDLRGF